MHQIQAFEIQNCIYFVVMGRVGGGGGGVGMPFSLSLTLPSPVSHITCHELTQCHFVFVTLTCLGYENMVRPETKPFLGGQEIYKIKILHHELLLVRVDLFCYILNGQ